MKIDTFTVTLIVIMVSALIGAFRRRRKIDKCLKDFENSPTTVERINGEIMAKGILNVENTGLELKYPEKIIGNNGLEETSCLIFKYEYTQIQAVIRYHDELSEKGKIAREKELRRTYKPSFFRRTRRKFQSILKTIKDSLSEIANTMFSQFKKTSTGAIFKTHDKYVKQINSDLIESVGSAYEPLLERYIGYKVVFELIKEDKLYKYSGILKEYTTDFIEIIDVNYNIGDEQETRLADLVLPQKLAIVRHLGELKTNYNFLFVKEIKDFAGKISDIAKKMHRNKKEDPANKKINS